RTHVAQRQHLDALGPGALDERTARCGQDHGLEACRVEAFRTPEGHTAGARDEPSHHLRHPYPAVRGRRHCASHVEPSWVPMRRAARAAGRLSMRKNATQARVLLRYATVDATAAPTMPIFGINRKSKATVTTTPSPTPVDAMPGIPWP